MPEAVFFDKNSTSRRKMTPRLGLVSVVALVTAGLAILVVWLVVTPATAVSAPSRTPIPVETQRVIQSDELVLAREFTGRIEAARASTLSFEHAGLVTAILVDEGDVVEANQALAQLDCEPLRLRLRQLRAELAAARARLAEMEAGPRAERIAAARAQLREREARVAFWAREQDRVRGLIERGAAGTRELQDTDTEHAAAVALRDGARAQLGELEAGTRTEQLEAQSAIVTQLAAAVAKVDLDLEKSTIRAPFAGTISSRLADEGLVVSAGVPVLEILETGHLQARIGVAVDMAEHLSIGQKRTLEINGDLADCTIARILPQLDDATRTVTVLFDLPKPGPFTGKPGQTIRFRLEDRWPERGFWLPTDALVKGERGLWAVYAVVARPGHELAAEHVNALERRDVEILYTEADRAYARGLLREGDEIVSSGAHRVVAGQEVSPRAASQDATISAAPF